MMTNGSGTTWYTGPIYRGVDYSPTWPTWVVGPGGTQTHGSDFANDAFQSFWSNEFKAAPSGDSSAPVDNQIYRDDLSTIQGIGLNLIRLYDWDMARGSSSDAGPSLGHVNFLDYADSLGLKVVVPVSDYFLGDNQYSWNNISPSESFDFSSAPSAIQTDFNLFISSIIDPTTQKIHNAVHSISVGNEGDVGEGISGTTASNFLARTIWWIYNLHLQINGSGTGPNGNPVVNGASPVIPISATFTNADQGGSTGSWFQCVIDGVTAGQATPYGCTLGSTFATAVSGLSVADSSYTDYYYNSVNVSQVSTASPYTTNLAATLGDYDSGATPWPGAKFDVPLLFMEVFAPNRGSIQGYDQAAAAVSQITALESYLSSNKAGTSGSTTNFMGYNYFEFNDEQKKKLVGLYEYDTSTSQNAQTGTTSVWYPPNSFPNYTFPVVSLTPAPGPSGSGQTLVDSIKALLPT